MFHTYCPIQSKMAYNATNNWVLERRLTVSERKSRWQFKRTKYSFDETTKYVSIMSIYFGQKLVINFTVEFCFKRWLWWRRLPTIIFWGYLKFYQLLNAKYINVVFFGRCFFVVMHKFVFSVACSLLLPFDSSLCWKVTPKFNTNYCKTIHINMSFL